MHRSPFPGMDPFIESHEWPPFHHTFLAHIVRYLVPLLPDGYSMAPETGVKASDFLTGDYNNYRLDIALEDENRWKHPPVAGGAEVLDKPTDTMIVEAPTPRTITIRTIHNSELITAIELLSPANKVGHGMVKYLEKRDAFIQADVNIVEIDLLRGGEPPFAAEHWPDSAYRIQVYKATTGLLQLWAVNLDERLPKVPVPLLSPDPALALDLQAVFDETYHFGLYKRVLRYDTKRLRPAVGVREREVVEEILESVR